ncbi:hypothetical protein [Novosphingobium huizhouense]|uniref:hypothetical protein n=1 Tax=Novosphingobium huizhouense TaxID=2866625 RepID=UPI001CD89002|nr:hypothetical protein [Novosphingobium huizhouense]
MSAPDCHVCQHMVGRLTCARPTGARWNPATNRHRSRLDTPIALERSTQRSLLRRRRCGPEGYFFEPVFPTLDVAQENELGPIGDSDGDDGA